MKKIFIALLGTSLLLASGCYYDKEEELYPVSTVPCTPGAVTLSGTITPLLNTYGCAGCHGSSFPAANISVNVYSSLKSAALSGRLYGAITHAPGFSPMPDGGAKMNACDIAKFKAWIDAGAPNN
jgi:hypothetical protein